MTYLTWNNANETINYKWGELEQYWELVELLYTGTDIDSQKVDKLDKVRRRLRVREVDIAGEATIRTFGHVIACRVFLWHGDVEDLAVLASDLLDESFGGVALNHADIHIHIDEFARFGEGHVSRVLVKATHASTSKAVAARLLELGVEGERDALRLRALSRKQLLDRHAHQFLFDDASDVDKAL